MNNQKIPVATNKFAPNGKITRKKLVHKSKIKKATSMKRALFVLLAFQLMGLPGLIHAVTPKTISYCAMQSGDCDDMCISNKEKNKQNKTQQRSVFCNCDHSGAASLAGISANDLIFHRIWNSNHEFTVSYLPINNKKLQQLYFSIPSLPS